ncbi:MAG: hypothetical protein QXU98_04210 [Candidatus Parvarchaeota archaeon]
MPLQLFTLGYNAPSNVIYNANSYNLYGVSTEGMIIYIVNYLVSESGNITFEVTN